MMDSSQLGIILFSYIYYLDNPDTDIEGANKLASESKKRKIMPRYKKSVVFDGGKENCDRQQTLCCWNTKESETFR